MKKLSANIVSGISLLSVVFAEENADTSVVLENISIVEQVEASTNELQSSRTYDSFDPLDSGLSVISEEAISASHQGNIDTTELLKALPFVQLDVERYEGSARAEQHLNPSDFTISGARFYDNNIMVDGVSVNSVMDVTQSQDNIKNNEVSGQTAQTFYVHPSLLEAVEVLDSNVSAKYGSFRGGVVDYQMREPADEYGAKIQFSAQSDEMVYYLGEDAEGDPYPDFIKYKTDILVDTPLTDKLKLLSSYTRSESKSFYQMDEDYGGEEFTDSDISQNFLLKGLYELSDDLSVEGVIAYSPYTSERTEEGNTDSEQINLSTGLISYLKLKGSFTDIDWSSKLSYNLSDASRDWDGDRYKWDSQSEYGGSLCENTYCYQGGQGDIYQKQQDYALNLSASHFSGIGTLSAGSEFKYTHALKERPNSDSYYNKYVTDEGAGITCASDDDACQSDTAFTSKVVYGAYKADVGVYNQALWSEIETDIAMVTMRTGLRYDYDDYLGNHNIAPRFSSAWEIIPDAFLSFGANRYYKGDMLVYAVKEATPASTTYIRELNGDGSLSDWVYSDSGSEYFYSALDLKTPYSDELSLAFTLPTPFQGNFRVKGIKRLHRDSFSSNWEFDSDDNQNLELSNGAKSDYYGLSVEWNGQYKEHSFGALVVWSKIKNYGFSETYFEDFDIDEQKSNLVYYDGEVLSEYELSQIEALSNFAAPLKVKVDWSKTWFGDRLLTSVSMNYRGSYRYIDDTNGNILDDGVLYDLYDIIETDAYTDFSLNTKLEVFNTAHTQTILDVRVSNLLNNDPYSEGSTYRRGRAYWVGATINFF